MAFGNRARQPAIFIGEAPVITIGIELLLVKEAHHDQANRQRHQDHPESALKDRMQPRSKWEDTRIRRCACFGLPHSC